jgi:hypothetical protein
MRRSGWHAYQPAPFGRLFAAVMKAAHGYSLYLHRNSKYVKDFVTAKASDGTRGRSRNRR